MAKSKKPPVVATIKSTISSDDYLNFYARIKREQE